MPASVYIESSVISYLTARPSRDVVTAARQAITLDRWQKQRHKPSHLLRMSLKQAATSAPFSVPPKNYAYLAMIDDPIVEEVRAHRQAHAARFNYDLAAIFADLIEREKNSSRPVRFGVFRFLGVARGAERGRSTQ